MSRIGYSDEEDYPGQFELWRSNLNRSLQGRRGQAALRDLEAALLALPEKRLIANHLVKDDGVCANGALVAHRVMAKEGMTREQVLERMREETAPACANCWHAKASHGPLGCTRCATIVGLWLAENPEPLAAQRPYYIRDCVTYDPRATLDDDGEYDEDEQGSTEDAAEAVGVPRMVAWAIVEQNDDVWGERSRIDETDEQRYDRVLEWVRRNLKEPASVA